MANPSSTSSTLSGTESKGHRAKRYLIAQRFVVLFLSGLAAWQTKPDALIKAFSQARREFLPLDLLVPPGVKRRRRMGMATPTWGLV